MSCSVKGRFRIWFICRVTLVGIVFKTLFVVAVGGLVEVKSLEKYLIAIFSMSECLSVHVLFSSNKPVIVLFFRV